MNNTEKFCLVGKIKGLAKEAQHARALISRAKKEEKVWSLAAIKRSIGVDARHHLLAYGFLKGIPYRMMEAKCREDNLPNSHHILTVLMGQMHGWVRSPETLAKIKDWLLDVSFTPVVQPKRVKTPYVKSEC